MTDPIINIDLGPNNGVLKLNTLEELRTWFQNETTFYKWLGVSPVQNAINGPWSVVGNGQQQIGSYLRQLTDDNLVALPTVRQFIEQTYRSQLVPLSTSPVGQFVEELRADDPIVAAAAIAIWLNAGGVNYSQFRHVKGATLMAMFDANITSRTPSAVRKSLETLQRTFQESRSKTEQETTDQRQIFEADLKRQRRDVARSIRIGRRRLLQFRMDKDIEILDAINRLQDTERLYKEHMRIKGPVEYWSNKATVHRSSASSYQKTLLLFAGFGGLALVAALSYIASHAISIASAEKPPAIYLVLVTIGIVISTIVFWAARVLTRLFLSEHHLAIDADERAVMAQTYLALTAEGQATDAERGIVLASLFRPTADGIVKDDAAPDISPASLLSRLGSK